AACARRPGRAVGRRAAGTGTPGHARGGTPRGAPPDGTEEEPGAWGPPRGGAQDGRRPAGPHAGGAGTPSRLNASPPHRIGRRTGLPILPVSGNPFGGVIRLNRGGVLDLRRQSRPRGRALLGPGRYPVMLY